MSAHWIQYVTMYYVVQCEYVCTCVCVCVPACMYAFMSVCCCISVCVRGYVTTCSCLHTHYIYLSTYSLHVLIYILTTCTCLHTHHMYLSAGGQGDAIFTDLKITPINDLKITPVNDQPSVFGELTDSGQMVQNYNLTAILVPLPRPPNIVFQHLTECQISVRLCSFTL